MNQADQFHFQVNLQAMIELLSSHLYSGPQVFVRELLQNSVDAIRAHLELNPSLNGHIEMEVSQDNDGGVTLLIEDNGIGLTKEEVHQFLATIGSSSKRDDLLALRSEYIGQFGIGLLSCFIVTDEIVLITRSARDPQSPGIEWRGKADGSYQVREIPAPSVPGTKVYLRCARGKELYFRGEYLIEHARHYGSLLPFPVTVSSGGTMAKVNVVPPWRGRYADSSERDEAYLSYGRELFGDDFFDYIPLTSAEKSIEGAAYVMAYSPNLSAKRQHRVYLKDMLLADAAENLLPEWAFFVKCALNTRTLRPTASREGLYEDDELEEVREFMGTQLRDYLIQLAKADRDRLGNFIEIHSRAMKSLALHDSEFLLMILDYLPFQTSLGELTLPECRARSSEIRYVSSLDDFRQISGLSVAEDLCILNAGYVYDTELLLQLGALDPDRAIEPITPRELMERMDEVSLQEREKFFDLIHLADVALQPFKCRADVRRFEPETLPCIHIASGSALFRRSLDDAKAEADSLWGGMLGNAFEVTEDAYSQFCINAANPLMQRLAQMARRQGSLGVQRAIEVLYVQSLLLARRSPTKKELALMNRGILSLVEAVATTKELE